MIPAVFFLVMAAGSLAICHFLGSSDPSKLNRWDFVFAPAFNIALIGLAISVLYDIVIFLKTVSP